MKIPYEVDDIVMYLPNKVFVRFYSHIDDHYCRIRFLRPAAVSSGELKVFSISVLYENIRKVSDEELLLYMLDDGTHIVEPAGYGIDHHVLSDGDRGYLILDRHKQVQN